MRQRYKLLKDSAECKEGAIFEEMCDDGTQDFVLIEGEQVTLGVRVIFSRNTVESQPKWFEKIVVFYVPKNLEKQVKKILKLK